jgi:hypothetical protein
MASSDPSETSRSGSRCLVFVNSRRIREFLPRLRPVQIELHNSFSLVDRSFRTPLAFDVLILR